MAEDNEQFRQRLFNTFLKEADAQVLAISALLARPDDERGQEDVLTDLLRKIHSLKGAAGAVGQHQVELLCRSLEQVLHKVVRGERQADAEVFACLRHGIALLEDGLPGIAGGGSFTISLQFLESVRKLT